MTELQGLLELFNIVSDRDFAGKKKYYHLRTVYNFIVHFDELEDGSAKSSIYDQLYAYLSLIEGVDDLGDIESRSSRDIFDEYLYPIAKQYDQLLRFSPYANFGIIFMWYFVLNAGLFMFSAPVFLYYLLLLFFITHYALLIRKKMKRKVYGLFY